MMRDHLPPIIITCIPHRMQRYDTTGDWFELQGNVHFNISQMDLDKELETLLHEIFEWHLCQKGGVTEKMVDDWDMSHPELEDPGSHPDCPYRPMHVKAMFLSKFVVKKMGYQWKFYDQGYNSMADRLSEEWSKAHK